MNLLNLNTENNSGNVKAQQLKIDQAVRSMLIDTDVNVIDITTEDLDFADMDEVLENGIRYVAFLRGLNEDLVLQELTSGYYHTVWAEGE